MHTKILQSHENELSLHVYIILPIKELIVEDDYLCGQRSQLILMQLALIRGNDRSEYGVYSRLQTTKQFGHETRGIRAIFIRFRTPTNSECKSHALVHNILMLLHISTVNDSIIAILCIQWYNSADTFSKKTEDNNLL